MNLAPAILGSTAVEKLKETAHAAVIQVGRDKITRAQLARVECYNFAAARNLSHILTEVLGVPNLKHVYEQVPPAALAVPRLGVVSLAVLGAAFEALGIGGDTPLESYVERHRPEHAKTISFPTLKHREQSEEARERQERKRRKRQRRNQAHQLRTKRFEERQGGGPS